MIENKARYSISYPADGDGMAPSSYNAVLKITKAGDRKHTLRYSNDGIWTRHTKGTKAVQFTDDGNGVDIKFANKPKFRLDYSEMEQLSILLEMFNATDPQGPPVVTKHEPVVLLAVESYDPDH